MMKRSLAGAICGAALSAAAACSDEPLDEEPPGDEPLDDDSCLPTGTASIGGTVMGHVYGDSLKAQQFITNDTGPNGRLLGISIWEDQGPSALLEFCLVPSVGRYELHPHNDTICQGRYAFLLLEDERGRDELAASSGTLDIESVTPQCVRGTYSARIGNEVQTATFDAYISPTGDLVR